jgi:hypothetical protein
MWDAVLAHVPESIAAMPNARRSCRGHMPAHALKPDDAHVYNSIVSGRTDDQLRELVACASTTCRGITSARSMHTFVVKYAPAIDMHVFITEHNVSNTPINGAVTVNVHASYANKMALFGKPLFDAFGRGHLVTHELTDGSVINLSLCRLNFYMWAQEIRLVEIMHIFAVDFKRFQDTGESALVPRPIMFNGVCVNVTPPSIAFLDLREAEIAAASGDELLELLIDVHDDAVVLCDGALDEDRCALEELQMQMIELAECVRAQSY